ncbi:MAG TPA: hypothetical protein VGP73_06985 [Thermoanaerobaculia bacterium]
MTRRRIPLIAFVSLTVLNLSLLGGGVQILAAQSSCVTVVDGLGTATPGTKISVFGTGGVTLSTAQRVGPQFTLTQDAVLNEIGAIVNNCKVFISGVPQCPQTSPLTVEIHPAINGLPDPSTVLATFLLSHDDDPFFFSFESARIELPLPAGTYFALFGAQGDDGGDLLNNSGGYLPLYLPTGFILLPGPRVSVTSYRMPVRILADCVIQVAVDLKPGSFPNTVNPQSRGVLPVAIWSTGAFDASLVDPASVRFGATGKEAAPDHFDLEDLNADGHLDLILQFRTQETGISCDTTSVSLTGRTFSGQPIAGSDSLRAVGCL